MLLRNFAFAFAIGALDVGLATRQFPDSTSALFQPPSRAWLSAATLSAALQRVNVFLPDGSGTAIGAVYPQFGLDGFLGIPYAQPPVGALRFDQPKALAPNSTRIFDASQYGLACLQPTVSA